MGEKVVYTRGVNGEWIPMTYSVENGHLKETKGNAQPTGQSTSVKREHHATLDRGQVAAERAVKRRKHRQEVGDAQADAEAAQEYYDRQLRDATEPTIYGKLADAIHTIGTIGSGLAYGSGNPVAVAAASGYSLPQFVSQLVKTGVPSSEELLSMAAPAGRVGQALNETTQLGKALNLQEAEALVKGKRSWFKPQTVSESSLQDEANYLKYNPNAKVTHPYTLQYLENNPGVADILGSSNSNLQFILGNELFSPSASTVAQALDKAKNMVESRPVRVMVGYSGMGPASFPWKGHDSTGNYEFGTQNFAGAANYAYFQPEEIQQILADPSLSNEAKEYLQEQLAIIDNITKKYGTKAYSTQSTNYNRFKKSEETNKYPGHAGHKALFNQTAEGKATGAEYSAEDLAALLDASNKVGAFLGGGNKQAGGLGQVYHIVSKGDNPIFFTGKGQGWKDKSDVYRTSGATMKDRGLLTPEKENHFKNDEGEVVIKSNLNDVQKRASNKTNQRPLIFTNLYDPIYMDTQAVPANGWERTYKTGGRLYRHFKK